MDDTIYSTLWQEYKKEILQSDYKVIMKVYYMRETVDLLRNQQTLHTYALNEKFKSKVTLQKYETVYSG